MTLPRGGRTRIVHRPGLARYAGPSSRQLLVARWLPILVPLFCQGLWTAGLHLAPVYFFLAAVLLALSGRALMVHGLALGLLGWLQLTAALLAAGLLGAYLMSPDEWLRHSGDTLLLVGYTSFGFNFVASYLPR